MFNIFKKKKKKCVCYYRESKITQTPYVRQQSICKNYCEKNNFEIIHEFSETISGLSKIEKRTLFLGIITFCIKNNIDTIIISEVDRFGRELKTCKQLIDILKSSKINVYFVSEKYTLNKNENEIILKIEFAYNEVKQIQHRLNTGRERYKQHGGKLGRYIGYRKPISKKQEEYKNAIYHLKRGLSYNDTLIECKECGEKVSISTLKRLKKLIVKGEL